MFIDDTYIWLKLRKKHALGELLQVSRRLLPVYLERHSRDSWLFGVCDNTPDPVEATNSPGLWLSPFIDGNGSLLFSDGYIWTEAVPRATLAGLLT